ncbi:soluble quino protein glucose dehydrogenase [Didymella exigua CBS 183.55]|uniref:Soluble quino protein glucose dehydrogenase n=1 Tax=Didymella exigua CBS 183.55 TaxID=1150837 RepID=A0A6A5RZX1_9PLEO|nr:soluble quino protein glucose dehydrogenase [Didymella exigua CBS 183.55]KAF1930807.1 soluble quino protein glucose dehydrogenase [Didymella exigua CBS 183.55]
MSLRRLTALFSIAFSASAQSTALSACSSTIAPQNAAPSVAPGFRVEVVANNLTRPRSIQFDSEGALLVVEQSQGVRRIRLSGDGICVRQDGEAQNVTDNTSLNHGLALSENGRTLYASSASAVYAWDYDPSQGLTTSESRRIVGDFGTTDGHVTRTLLFSQAAPGMLLVSRGSGPNVDLRALDRSKAISTIKAFNVTNATSEGYSYINNGLLLGWGLRNSVGVGEEPVTGGIYSVENSVDNFQRDTELINENNPGEEMNFHGYLNGTQYEQQGGNYGYPTCYAAWNVSEIPDNQDISVGSQFAIGSQNDTVNDESCRDKHIAPRLTFQAHMAPIDVKFNTNGTGAWVSFRGSWNREDPIGYKISFIRFDGHGSPIAAANSTTAAVDIVSNPDLSECPDNCFRPASLAWDTRGRLFFSSDATGEIYVITREDGSGVNSVSEVGSNGTSSGGGSGTGTSAPSPTSSSSAAVMQSCRVASIWAAGAVAVALAL